MHFFHVTFKNSLVYRWSVVFSILGSVLFIAINLVLWRFLFRDNPDMVGYMTRYTIISNIIGMFYASGISARIGDKVASGAFVVDLIKPVNLFTMSWQMELASISSRLLLMGLPVIVVYLPFLIAHAGYYHVPGVLLAVALGHLLYLLIYSLLGFSAFILLETWAFKRLLDDTIRLVAGAFIPLAILPQPIKGIAEVLPFRFLYSFPLELLLGDMDMAQAAANYVILLVWVAIFALLNLLMYRLALRKAVVQGG